MAFAKEILDFLVGQGAMAVKDVNDRVVSVCKQKVAGANGAAEPH
jgi:hypothetical protein